MSDLKPTIIFAVVGFILSFLVGLISGVNFLAILFRALIIAGVCGAFAFLVLNVLKKYLPELFSDREPTKKADSDLGKNLNIVLDEDTKDGEKKTTTESEIDKTQFDASEFFPQAETPELNTESENATKKADAFSAELNLRSDTNTSESELQNGSVNVVNDVLDELPDMSQFENPLAGTVEEITSDLVDAGTESVTQNTANDFSDGNVTDMARAIHTVLKKDSD